MFVDKAKIYVKGGDGGNGLVAFRREKFVPEGGPSGGDGGRGGDVIFLVDEGLRTLMDFRYQKHFKADRGEHGQRKNMHGKNAEDLVVKVPPGTMVRDEATGNLLADLTEHGQSAVIAKGGRGGRGNARFVTSVNRVPGFAENGEPGEEHWVILELKLLADVGLVGFPNAGKSTLLSRVSKATPKIAAYPFTTIAPNLGVVTVPDGRSFVLADIPGLIEGAHEGAGLGHEFLRHIERTRVLIHLVDGAGSEGRDPLEDFQTINRELALHNPSLARKKQIVGFNKMDLPEARERWPLAEKWFLKNEFQVLPLSGVTGEGMDQLLYLAANALDEVQSEPEEEYEAQRVYRAEDEREFTITREGPSEYRVEGKFLERLVAMTNLDNEEALFRFHRILRRLGVEKALRNAGAADGDTVRIRNAEFELNPGLGVT